jgi:hypothetical protein
MTFLIHFAAYLWLHNVTQHNGVLYNNKNMTFSITKFSITTLSIERRYADCHILSAMLSVVILSDIMLHVFFMCKFGSTIVNYKSKKVYITDPRTSLAHRKYIRTDQNQI